METASRAAAAPHGNEARRRENSPWMPNCSNSARPIPGSASIPRRRRYKYFPAKIEWRMRHLERLLEEEFPRVAQQIRDGEPLWPAFTGQQPLGRQQRCPRVAAPPPLDGRYDGPGWGGLPEAELDVRDGGDLTAERQVQAARTLWKCCHDESALYVAVRCVLADGMAPGSVPNETITLRIEPRRLWPCQSFSVSASGGRDALDGYELGDSAWTAALCRGRRVVCHAANSAAAPASRRFDGAAHACESGAQRSSGRRPRQVLLDGAASASFAAGARHA